MNRLFNEGKIGPVTIPNRSIRAAAFDGMSLNHGVTHDLIDYHVAVARGGIGMTTVAYVAVSKSGISFPHQMWIREEITTNLQELTKGIHDAGAKASVQLGHGGNMAAKSVTGMRPLAPTGGINLYGPTFPKTMTIADIESVIRDFQTAVLLSHKAGFDAVEIHAGHGYLISQFLSPFTNKRKDEFGGTFENRSRFLSMVIKGISEVLPDNMALIVKMNCSDGFADGITPDEALQTARIIQECGAHAIVVSGGFVSRSPMYVLRGSMPVDIMAWFVKNPVMKFFVKVAGSRLIKEFPFSEGYFMEMAKKIQQEVSIPVILVGGMNSKTIITKAFDEGFEWIAIARALIHNPKFINDLKAQVIEKSDCTICNYCVAKIYSSTMTCHMNEDNIPDKLKRKIELLG